MSPRAEREQDGSGKGTAVEPQRYEMRLFVAGNGPNSAIARDAVQRLCTERLQGNCRIEVVDVLEDSQPALQENILATPALIVRYGQARTVVFGNLTKIDRVLAALHLESE